VYAVVQTGGRQYRVEPGQVVDVAHLPAAPGSEVALGHVLLVGEGEALRIGRPTVPGAQVIAEVLGDVKGKKIIVFKYKAKSRYRRKTGHRQVYSRVRIKEIIAA